MSQSSEDYSQIMQSLLMSQRQWQEVPEIAFLTIKAICQHVQGMEDKICRNKQILTQQSIKLRQIDLKLENLTSEVFYQKELLTGLDPLTHPETGFRKKKKENNQRQKSKDKSKRKGQNLHNITYGNQSQFSQSMFSDNKQKNQSFNIEDLHSIAVAMIDEHSNKLGRKIESQNQEYQKGLITKMEQSQKQLEKWTKKIQQQLKQQQISSARQLIDVETKFSMKILQNQTEIMNVFEENFLTKDQFRKQFSKKIEQIMKQAERSKSRQKKNEKAIPKKKNQKKMITQIQENNLQEKNSKRNQNMPAISQYSSRQLSDIKFQVAKQLHSYAKMADVENIMTKFHQQLLKKICKLSNIVESLERESNKKQMIHQMSSVSLRPTVVKKNQTDREFLRDQQDFNSDRKNTEKSLTSIQQSLKNLEKTFKQKISAYKKQMSSKMHESLANLEKTFREDMEEREKYFCQIVEQNCKNSVKNDRQQTLVAVNQTNTKKILDKLSSQMIIARYLHYGENECKQFIKWQKQAFNAMEENFVWKNGQNMITIIQSGLYRVQAGLYNITDIEKVIAYLVLNGENVGIFPHRQLPKNSQTKAKGMIFSEPLLIPAKSKISIRVQSTFYGQAYLQIQKL